MPKYFITIALFFACSCIGLHARVPYDLSNSHPSHPDFKKNVMGLYGVHTAIEPDKISSKERSLYEKIVPHLESNPDLAIDILSKEVSEENNANFDYLLGTLYFNHENLENAKLWLDKAIKKVPNFRRAFRIKALIHFRQNNYNNCTQDLLKVIQLGGGDSQSYGLLAYCYINAEKYASALEAYERAKLFEPDNKDFNINIARCYMELQEYKKVIGLFEEILQEKHDDKNLWLAQSNAFLYEGRISEAIANLEIVRAKGDANFNTLAHLSQIYYNEDIESLSTSAIVDGLKQIKTNDDYKKVIKILDMFISKQWYKGTESIIQAIPANVVHDLSNRDKTLLELAKVSLNLGLNKREEAYQSLKSILKQDPVNGPALLLLGNYYHIEGRIEEAIFQYERASQLEEHQFEALISLAKLYVDKSEFGDALKALYQAKQLKSATYLLNYIKQVEQAYRSTY